MVSGRGEPLAARRAGAFDAAAGDSQMTRFWPYVLDRMLREFVQFGSLRVVMPDQSVHTYGTARRAPVTVHLHTTQTVRQLALNAELAVGESYMNGTLTVAGDELQELAAVLVRNARHMDANKPVWQNALDKTRDVLRGFTHNNIVARARHNVAHHYDLSGELFDLFLDGDRQYSCGYFKDQNTPLEQAQRAKKAYIARKLVIKPGMNILDIGCGWGGMALTLARDHGAKVVGITLSEEQCAYATKRAARAGLSDQVQFRLCDYRHIRGQFDRIVSVGMFEHVGLRHFNAYFDTIRNRLSPSGVALIHTIGWAAPPRATNPWIAKYIFPGGYIPSVSEVMRAVEGSRLWATDIECWRLHYAYTLRHWFDRFNANEDIVRSLYDDRFIRMWRFYLAACEQTFRHAPQAVYQFQLTRDVGALPLTREYLYQSDNAAPRLQVTNRSKKPVRVGQGSFQTSNAETSKSHRTACKEKRHDHKHPSGR